MPALVSADHKNICACLRSLNHCVASPSPPGIDCRYVLGVYGVSSSNFQVSLHRDISNKHTRPHTSDT